MVQLVGRRVTIHMARFTGLWIFLYHATSITTAAINDPTIRLAGGTVESEGRIEVYYGDRWGTVCDNLWTLREADVACRQLNYTGAERVLVGGYFGKGTGDILLDMVQCDGSEASLFDCGRGEINATSCDHTEDVGVVCITQGSVRIDGRIYDGEPYHQYQIVKGRLQVINNAGIWSWLCWYEWKATDESVTAKALGYSSCYAKPSLLTNGSEQAIHGFPGELRCTGNETRLDQCPGFSERSDSCISMEVVHLWCSYTELYLLRESIFSGQGRVQINYGGSTGSICSNGWSIDDAGVVCRLLGYPKALAAQVVARGDANIILTNPACRGNETSIADCKGLWAFEGNCTSDNVAWVVCERRTAYLISLLSGGNSYEGVVEYMEDLNKAFICDPDWGDAEATVACRMTGHQDGTATAVVTLAPVLSGNIINRNYTCTGDEASLDNCTYEETSKEGRDCLSENIAQVSCGPVKDFDYRLVGSTYPEQGRIEIFMAGVWGTVTVADNLDARKDGLCLRVGYGDGVKAYHLGNDSPFEEGSGPVYYDDWHRHISESITESSVTWEWMEELLRNVTGTDRPHSYDVGVVCAPYESVANHPIRLISSNGTVNTKFGAVEIYRDGEWGGVLRAINADSSTSIRVPCRELNGDFIYNEGRYLNIEDEGTYFNRSEKLWYNHESCSSIFIYRFYQCEHSAWGAVNESDGYIPLAITCVSLEQPPKPPTSKHLEAWEIVLIVLGVGIAATIVAVVAYLTLIRPSMSTKPTTSQALGTISKG